MSETDGGARPTLPNAVAAMEAELTAWRRDFHRHPELGYEETRTASVVAEKLRAFGLDAVATGVGRTGVIGTLHGAGGAGAGAERAIMIRADMDALPISEATGAEHASTRPGVMHACGHDGHTTMLLGAAKRLAETRAFEGTVHFCFQPAEEGGAGAKAMMEDGLFDRFPVSRIFGLHNWPGLPVGQFALKDGPVFAGAAEINIHIRGQGGHAAFPHHTTDIVVATGALIQALQGVVSRRVDANATAVLSICEVKAGDAHNVLPSEALLRGTTRAFDKGVGERMHAEIARIAEGVGTAHGVEITVEKGDNPYPPMFNDTDVTDFAEGAMRQTFGDAFVTRGHPLAMVGEDFAFMSEFVPGCYLLCGNGDTAALHHPAYDFDDSALTAGVALWSGIVEQALPRG
ncbi:MAG: M20 aminoacylase family protein [Pseudomonadota bacterium]